MCDALLHVDDRSACGVGFVASRRGTRSRAPLAQALHALACVEHRGACAADRVTGDGAGVMTDLPFDLLGYQPGAVAVASLFITGDERRRVLALFEESCAFMGLEVMARRDVPIRPEVLGPIARETLPMIVQVIFARPKHCRTDHSLNTLLYLAKQQARSRLKPFGLFENLTFCSFSTSTIVYKALTRSADLVRFYPDLDDPRYATRFALFHRRFSTNTRTAWDKVQPFRLIAHNGEINTIAGNRSWAYSREQALGVRRDELLTHDNTSDSGNFNEMVEALKYRSSIPHVEDILAIMLPPATERSDYYDFWGRAMEPWDGPAFITYADGKSIGGRLDRNGFRPCRWLTTDDAFYVASEAGVFAVTESEITAKGTLHAGSGVKLELESGELHLRDPSRSRENFGASFDPRLLPLRSQPFDQPAPSPQTLRLFGVTEDVLERLLIPMITDGKEPLGSMGDTAPIALVSRAPRPLFDFFFQTFAQVTNPPLDYIREGLVTDLTTYLGKRPNIFQPKELIPPEVALLAETPVLALGEVAYLRTLRKRSSAAHLKVAEIDTCLDAPFDAEALRRKLDDIAARALAAIHDDHTVIILSDRHAGRERAPIPSLLPLRAVVCELNRHGMRLDTSIVVDAGDVLSPHHLSCLIGFGAAAVCPRLALEIARAYEHKALVDLHPQGRERRLERALEGGLLKVMSKMGISVVRSYQSAKLFSAVGIGPELVATYFNGVPSPVGGIGLAHIAAQMARNAERAAEGPLEIHHYKEDRRGREGEHHAMTATRARLVHKMLRQADPDAWQQYSEPSDPTSIRHLLVPRAAPAPLEAVQERAEILRTFGSGAMSFGAISAEAQRDLVIAMRKVGGRSNSGEGGENPYYFQDGTGASTKQLASARFGVTAEYLVAGDEIEIKIAQGAKPGEGGQLMGPKVDEQIARARHARPGVDLISPAPLHDIYSIEDLKELIYELRQLAPRARVCVKLVSGAGIGTVAVGVAKAGADVIQISGGDGGTGAASLVSMKHAGLPWELGLYEVHRALQAQGLRPHVLLRVDGGLHTGRDVVMAAIWGAQEYGFGKLLLVGQGCIMARICETNRCPTGIATHDPKFKAKYKGTPEQVVALLERIADDVRQELQRLGVASLGELHGRTDLLVADGRHAALTAERHIDLRLLLEPEPFDGRRDPPLADASVGALNERIIRDAAPALERGECVLLEYPIRNVDRAVPARLCGIIAERTRDRRQKERSVQLGLQAGAVKLVFTGSAGQGFAAFLIDGLEVELRGEANDGVAKSMAGGRVTIAPHPEARFEAERNVIIGNAALYGATGGTLLVRGQAGDRFAVRNSGARAVVEGVGLHACEYMTGGTVAVLGRASYNVGAGMTGGAIFLRREQTASLSADYCVAQDLDEASAAELAALLAEHRDATGSETARALLADPSELGRAYQKCVPKREVAAPTSAAGSSATAAASA